MEKGSQHYDTGFGNMVQGDRWDGKGLNIIKRDLSNPKAWKTILAPDFDLWETGSHISMTGTTDEWAMVSTYLQEDQADTRPFISEIFMVKTDGSGKVLRLAKTRNMFADYWDSPFGNISYDGRLFAFSSNWGGTRSIDIGKIPKGVWK